MSGVIGNLIAQALTGARPNAMAKIAAEGDASTCEGCGSSIPADSKMCKECSEKKAKSEARESGHAMEGDGNKPYSDGDQEKTSSALVEPVRVEKLANALDYITMNSHLIDWGEVNKLAAGYGSSPTTPDVAPGSGMKPPTDEGSGVEKTPTDLGGSVAHSIPTDPKVNATQLRTDNKEGEGNKSQPSAGVSGSKAGGVGNAVARIKQAMAKAAANMDPPVPEQPVQVSSGPAPAGLQRQAEVAKQEQMVSSNEAVGDATPRQAREVPKRQTGEHLFEPMLSRKGDKAIDQMLGADKANEAGAKVASARAQELVAKIATSRCTCGGVESCGACRIRKVAEQRHAQTVGSMQGGAHNPVLGQA